MLALLADERDRSDYEKGPGRPEDVWEDEELVKWLKQGPEEDNLQVDGPMRGRAQWYRWKEGRLWRKLQEGWRVVPAPSERERLFWTVHKRLGHFGGRRTLQLLRTGYWWQGMQGQIKKWQATCETCQRAQHGQRQAEAELQSLPVRELGYRWSLDLLGELPMSRRGKRYVLVMIEHVSKWVEAVPLSSKSASLVAQHFLQLVLSRFGACAEVLTDQGKEFRGVFHQLLLGCKIRHRNTTAYHPRANGLTERAVQTIKRGLRKFVEEEEKRDWDLELPWILMGYRFSSQESLGVSPYYVLHGRQPILPVGSPVWLEQPLSAEEPGLWLKLCMAKARLFKQMMPTALDNLLAAQERDARRHAQRLGQEVAQGRHLRAGDWVWVRKQKGDTLEMGWSREKWRVEKVKETGVVTVRGPTGASREVRQEHCYRVKPGCGAVVVIEGQEASYPKGAYGTTQQQGRGEDLEPQATEPGHQKSTVNQNQQPLIVYQRRKAPL